MSHRFEVRIYYEDTDLAGIVYYANYLKYMEEARTLYLEERGVQAHGDFLYAVRKCEVTYKTPARYGDVVICETTLNEMSAAQITFTQKIFHKETQKLLVSAVMVLVSLTPNFKPVAIPDEIRAKLQPA